MKRAKIIWKSSEGIAEGDRTKQGQFYLIQRHYKLNGKPVPLGMCVLDAVAKAGIEDIPRGGHPRVKLQITTEAITTQEAVDWYVENCIPNELEEHLRRAKTLAASRL